MRDFRSEPMVLRIPISFALVAAFAVERLTKLMQAISKIKPAIDANAHIILMSPRLSVDTLSSRIPEEYRWISDACCKVIFN
ncbi:hypothetical protein D3C87_1384910 [compost metagenome]